MFRIPIGFGNKLPFVLNISIKIVVTVATNMAGHVMRTGRCRVVDKSRRRGISGSVVVGAMVSVVELWTFPEAFFRWVLCGTRPGQYDVYNRDTVIPVPLGEPSHLLL